MAALSFINPGPGGAGGEFKTTTAGSRRQNTVGASVVLSVTDADGSRGAIVVTP